MSSEENSGLTRLVGTWRLEKFAIEFQDTGETVLDSWHGRCHITPKGQAMWVITRAGRTEPVTHEERSAAYGTVHAVSGTIRVEGDVAIFDIDVASIPKLAGVVNRKTITHLGTRVRFTEDWGPTALTPRIHRTTTEWERE